MRLGVPLSTFLSENVAEETTHYGPGGEVTGTSVTVRPGWSLNDRQVVIAYLAEERDRCQGCGHPTDESMAKETAGKWTVTQKQCYACVVAQATAENNAQSTHPQRGVYMYTMRTPGV